MTSVPPLVLKHSAPWRRFPLLALVPLVLAAAVLAAFYVTGAAPADLTTPALGIGGLAVALGLLLTLVALVATANERRRIAQVRADAWAVFPQFASEQSWRDYADAEWQRERKSGGFPWSSVVVLIVMFAVITGVSATQLDAPPALFVGIGAMLALILTGLVVATQAGRWAARARYNRRRAMTVPLAYVGRWGIYDDDRGFDSLRSLRGIRFVPPGAAEPRHAASDAYFQHVVGHTTGLPLMPATPSEAGQWGELRFTVRYWRATRPYNWREYSGYTVVRIPPGRETDAQALIARFRAEVRGLKTE